MDSDDDNSRPSKRQRVEEQPSSPILPSSSLTPPPSSPIALTEDSSSSTDTTLRCLPPAVLLVSLPSLLAHPPNHRSYVQSLYLSLCALRKCLSLKELPPDIECRAWTSLAEVGMKVVQGGLTEDDGLPWARTIEAEVSGPSMSTFCAHILTTLAKQGREGPQQGCKHVSQPPCVLRMLTYMYAPQSIIAQKVRFS